MVLAGIVVIEAGNELGIKMASSAENDLDQLTSLPQDVQNFLSIHSPLHYIGSGKVRCDLTGHEMPCKLTAMESYTKGRKYQRLRQHSSCDLEKYKPHIVPSKKKGHGHQLFCTLTLRHISREPADIERHIKGKRYTRALAKYNECQELGVPFKPRCKIPRKDRMEWDSDQGPQKNSTDSEVSDEGQSDDSMSDLYPAADFEDEVADNRLEDHIENMDIDGASTNSKGGTTASKKRKNDFDSRKTNCKTSRKQASCSVQRKKFKDKIR